MGGPAPSKFQVARLVAAALGYAALCRLDCLHVFAFADGLTAASPPLRHKGQWTRLLEFLDSLALRQQRTELARAAESLAAGRCGRGPVVVVSDLLDPGGFCRGLDVPRWHGCWPRMAHVFDPREDEPGAIGDVELFDVETGGSRQATITPRMRRRHCELVAEFHDSVRKHCRKQDIPFGADRLHGAGGGDLVLAGASLPNGAVSCESDASMTTFAHPTALFCGLLALPVIAVYLRKPRWRRQATATGMFWDQVSPRAVFGCGGCNGGTPRRCWCNWPCWRCLFWRWRSRGVRKCSPQRPSRWGRRNGSSIIGGG